jgi:hypothetical protein
VGGRVARTRPEGRRGADPLAGTVVVRLPVAFKILQVGHSKGYEWVKVPFLKPTRPQIVFKSVVLPAP